MHSKKINSNLVHKYITATPAQSILCHQSVEDWEENWLFRRKPPPGTKPLSSLGSAISTSLTMLTNDPVAMLVPLPNEDLGEDHLLLGFVQLQITVPAEKCSRLQKI